MRVVQRKNEKQRNIKKTGEERNQRHLHEHIYSLPFLYCNFYKYIYTHTKHMLLRQIVISHVIALFVFGKGEGLQKFIQDSRGHADIFRRRVLIRRV